MPTAELATSWSAVAALSLAVIESALKAKTQKASLTAVAYNLDPELTLYSFI
ncbi:hypothetical protein CREGCYN_15450 [Synechococcus sp. M16CYN]